MEFMSQSVPQKNVAVEFHSPLKFVSCDKMFKLERDLELSEL